MQMGTHKFCENSIGNNLTLPKSSKILVFQAVVGTSEHSPENGPHKFHPKYSYKQAVAEWEFKEVCLSNVDAKSNHLEQQQLVQRVVNPLHLLIYTMQRDAHLQCLGHLPFRDVAHGYASMLGLPAHSVPIPRGLSLGQPPR